MLVKRRDFLKAGAADTLIVSRDGRQKNTLLNPVETAMFPRASRVLAVLALCALLSINARATEYSWQKPHAKVLPMGNLEWAPDPFAFTPGETVRYVDYAAGDDASPGTRARPWKHHPWDAEATGNAARASGPITYVFKRGVIYRGQLVADESGEEGNPIRLTSDPSWGQGQAMLFGSIRLPEGWHRAQADELPKYMPDDGKIWVLDTSDIKVNPDWIDNFARPAGDEFEVFSVFELRGGRINRLHVARDPDWQPGNPNFPLDYWHQWDGFRHGDVVDGERVGRGGQDEDLKGKPEDFFEGGYLASQWKGNMGTPGWRKIQEGHYNPEHGTLLPTGWFVGKGTRYMIENVPAYLDAPGEFYFAREGSHKGNLYLRMPDDGNPNEAVLEVPAIQDLIAIRDQSHIEISGLEFRFNRVNYVGDQFLMQISNPACVRIGGNCRDVRVSNNTFRQIVTAVSAFPRPDERLTELHAQGLLPWRPDDLLDRVYVSDNDIRYCEREAIVVFSGRGNGPGAGRLGHAEVLRNRLYEIGFRQGHWRYSAIPALRVWYPRTAEIAGNMIDRCWGCAIMVHGGKHGDDSEAPLTRILVHHNKVENTVLAVNDYGAISLWQGGPMYCFDNVSGNCVGHAPDRNLSSPWKNVGYPYYIDGGYKIYTFNNISWGRSNRMDDPYRNTGTYFMVFGFLNPVVNNTFFRAYKGIAGSSGNRSDILGNAVCDILTDFIASNRMGDPSLAGGGDTGEMGLRGVPTLAYANNLFYSDSEKTRAGRLYQPNRRALEAGAADKLIAADTVEEMSRQMQEFPTRCGKLGWRADRMPLRDPENRDYRPKPGSKAIDNGARYFVPWSLYATVGEWNFNQNRAHPDRAIDYHFYMTGEYFDRKMYEYIPTHDLKISEAQLDSYVESPSENWVPGALTFDGQRFGTVTDASMREDVLVNKQNWLAKPQVSKDKLPGEPWKIGDKHLRYPGRLRKTLDISTENLLVEATLRTQRGHGGGTVAGKSDGRTGYRLAITDRGVAALELVHGGKTFSMSTPEAVNDNQWHHVLAEIDRATGLAAMYLDGRQVGRKKLDLPADASLSNRADFVVGKGFRGVLDFLRVCQGTLADARTNIEELYTWQTEGPVTRDFCGNKPVRRRDVGALELVQ